MMKKCLMLLLAIVLITSTGCTNTTEKTPNEDVKNEVESTEEVLEPVDINAVAMKGPTAMGMLKFMEDATNDEVTDNNYNFSIVLASDELVPLLSKGEVDIAAVPANLASTLYNNTDGSIQVLAINTLGVLYIVENGDTIQTIEDLKGKTIYASGKGATPEFGLNYILEANGLKDEVTIEWKSEQAEVVAALASDSTAIGMLPQPFATTAQMKNDKIRIALDLTEEWDKTDTTSGMVTGVLVGRTEFVNENKEAVNAFLKHYKESTEYMNNNLEDGAALVGKYEIVPEAVALLALPECSITYIDNSEMKELLSGYLQELYNQKPESIGGSMPADDFYYAK